MTDKSCLCNIHEKDNEKKIYPHGNLSGETVEIFKNCIQQMINQEEKTFCFDLSNVEIINAEALRIFVVLSKQIKAMGATITIEHANPKLLDLFIATKIIQPESLKQNHSEDL